MLSYEKWLEETETALQEVLLLTESEGWHHAGSEGGRSAGYTLLVEIIRQVGERRRWYDTAQRLR